MKGITGASTIVMLAVGVAALAGALGPADDDLAVVKKAVASPAAKSAPASPATTEASALPLLAAQATAAQATPAARAAAEPPAPPRAIARSGVEPRWFRVRVVDKATGRRRVTVNLPLSLVRALGDEPIHLGCRNRMDNDHCRSIKISEVLQSLEAGQDLVEVDDDEATVRVWVD